MNDKQRYRLADGLERVTRAGLHLQRGDTVELTEAAAEGHSDVLEPAGGPDPSESEETDEEA